LIDYKFTKKLCRVFLIHEFRHGNLAPGWSFPYGGRNGVFAPKTSYDHPKSAPFYRGKCMIAKCTAI